eukprot:764961-Hanusia_phi.AAC.1
MAMSTNDNNNDEMEKRSRRGGGGGGWNEDALSHPPPATLYGTVALHPTAPLPQAGPLIKMKFD